MTGSMALRNSAAARADASESNRPTYEGNMAPALMFELCGIARTSQPSTPSRHCSVS